MVPFAHKKIPNALVTTFQESWKRPNTISGEWKTGPYMLSIKRDNVTITYWEKKGALMFQGPEAPTTNTNGEFMAFIRGTNAEETRLAENPRTNNDHECDCIQIPSPEPWQEVHTI